METSSYDALQQAAQSKGLPALVPWSELPEATRELVLRVLRRRDLARTLDSQEGLSLLEREVGIGEDRALRLHLLLTGMEALGSGLGEEQEHEASANSNGHGALPDAGPLGRVFTELLDDATRAWIVDSCWVYRADPLVPWDGLQHVETGFEVGAGEELAALAEARRSWDELPDDERLLLVAAGLRAVMLQYLRGQLPYPLTSRQIWGNAGVLRKLRRAAEQDRLNLLSDTAFESLATEERPRERFRGVEVLLDGEEAFLRRTALPAADVPEWSAALASWKPMATDAGETVFAWEWGGAVAVPERPLADHLEAWLDIALARAASA